MNIKNYIPLALAIYLGLLNIGTVWAQANRPPVDAGALQQGLEKQLPMPSPLPSPRPCDACVKTPKL